MRNQSRTIWSYARFSIIALSLIFPIAFAFEGKVSSDARKQSADQTKKSNSVTNADKKPHAQKRKSIGDKKLREEPKKDAAISPEEKRRQALSLIDGVLAGTDKIEPFEYGVLARVEAATLLWELDRQRALSLLNDSLEMMYDLEVAEEKDKEDAKRLIKKQKNLRFKVFAKIARLNPDLVIEYAMKKLGEDSTRNSISAESTEEARALMLVAQEMIEKDPELAAKLAEQSLPLGMDGWISFLYTLRLRDDKLAEETALKVIHRLRDSSASATRLYNFNSYALKSDISPKLQQEFYLALIARLRRDLRFDADPDVLIKSWRTAWSARRISDSTGWQAEFNEILYAFEEILTARSIAIPAPPRIIAIDTSGLESAVEGSTLGIEQQMQQTTKIKDSQITDKEYKQMAIAAAYKADARLAEELLSKIKNEDLRRETTMDVYGPLVRKAINDKEWLQAQLYASKIADPLGRILVVDMIGKNMVYFGVSKQLIKELYRNAASQLDRDAATEHVARAFMIMAKSLSSRDLDASLEAMNSAVYVMNKLARDNVSLGDSKVSDKFNPWMSKPSMLSPDDVLELTDMVGSLFKETARRTAYGAQMVAYGIAHSGLSSFAQLGIAGALLEESARPKSPPQRQKAVNR